MKLAQIPKPKVQEAPAIKEEIQEVDESVEGITTPNEAIVVYGLDPSDPSYPVELEHIRALKRRDPNLFKKMQSLD